ncbi:6-bladed beta-propeller [Acidobacteriota bacterium]
MRKIIGIVLCVLLVTVIFGQLQAQKIKTVKGVHVVENGKKPKPPKGALTKLVFKEEIAVGDSEDEEEMVAQPGFMEVDDKGTMYIVDMKASNIKVFDNTGNFVRTIGNKGDGPGEFNMPFGVIVTPAKELLVEDMMNRRLSYFTLDGEFIRNEILEHSLSTIGVIMDSKGNFMARELMMEGTQLFFELRKYDKDLNPVFVLDKAEFQNPLQGDFNPFGVLAVYIFDQDDGIYYGDGKVYEIKIYTPNGKLIRRILKKHDPIKITKEDEDRILNEIPDMGMGFRQGMKFPEYFPAYEFFALDEGGRLIVRTYKKGKNEGEYVLDIFDKEGRFIAQIPTRVNARIWKNNKAYSIEDTEEGYKVIKRYSYSWK